MSKGKKVVLSFEEKTWLCDHYPTMKNADCAKHLGISARTVCREAKSMGLVKSRQFMLDCHKEASEAARISHIVNGTHPKKGTLIPRSEEFFFKKGITPVMRLGEERNKQRIAKIQASRTKTWKSERARATFGLPQRTKFRVIPQPKKKVELRWYLKSRGYIVDDVKRIVYYDENTRRGKRIEEKPQRWYKFEPMNTQRYEKY